MSTPLPWLVYGTWMIIALLTVIAVGSALFFGLRGRGTPVGWRLVKLVSSLSGVIGIFFLMLSFEALVRTGFVGGPSPAHILSYMEARMMALHEMAVLCSQDGSSGTRRCNDLQSLARSLNYVVVRDAGKLTTVIQKENYDPSLARFIDDFSRAINVVNIYAEREENRYATLSEDARIKLFFFAAIFLSLAVAGAVGEAAFQLRQALDANNSIAS